MKKFAALAGLMMITFAAQAGMLGSTVSVDFFYPDTSSLYCSNGSAVVGGGVEYPSSCSGFAPVAIDISDTWISVDTGGSSWSPGSFNGIHLTVLSGPGIMSASYAGGTMGYTGLTVDSGSLWLNFAGVSPGGEAHFLIATVPEPGTYALMGLGLLGVAAIARRRRSQTA